MCAFWENIISGLFRNERNLIGSMVISRESKLMAFGRRGGSMNAYFLGMRDIGKNPLGVRAPRDVAFFGRRERFMNLLRKWGGLVSPYECSE